MPQSCSRDASLSSQPDQRYTSRSNSSNPSQLHVIYNRPFKNVPNNVVPSSWPRPSRYHPVSPIHGLVPITHLLGADPLTTLVAMVLALAFIQNMCPPNILSPPLHQPLDCGTQFREPVAERSEFVKQWLDYIRINVRQMRERQPLIHE